MSHRESALVPWITSFTDSFSAAGASTLTLTGFGLSLSTDVDLGTLGTETGRAYTATDGNGNGNLVISLNVATLPESPATVQVAVSNGGVPAQQSPLSVQHGVFDPTSIASLVAWYDASDASTITKDGNDFVSQWDDKSGNSNHVSQSSHNSKPKYYPSGGQIDGAHVKTSQDGSGHRHLKSSSAFQVLTDTGSAHVGSIFAVFGRPGTGDADHHDIVRLGSNAVGCDVGAEGTYFYVGGWKCTGGTAGSALPDAVLGGWIFGSGGLATRVNGSVDDTDTNNMNGAWQWVRIFTHELQANIEVSEVLIFKDELTGSDLSDVESYLNTKWSIY